MARYLTNRFHFAVRLYSDLTHRMTSKSGKNKEVRSYEPQASSVTDALTSFDVICASIHRTEKDGGCTFYHNTLRI